MNDKLNIENLFKSKLEELEYTPSPKVWEKTSRTLRRDAFLRFNPGRINIFYVAGVVMLGALLTIALSGDKAKTGSEISIEEISGQHSPSGIEGTELEKPQSQGADEKQQAIKVRKQKESLTQKKDTNTPVSSAENIAMEEQVTKSAETSQTTPAEVSTLITYFTPSTFEGCAPLEVELISNSINAEELKWDFGTEDRRKAQGTGHEVERFVYDEPGMYTITLTATNADGIQQSYSELITVHPKPTADFEIEDHTIYNYSLNATEYAWALLREGTQSSRNESYKISTDFQPDLKATSHLRPNTSRLLLTVSNSLGCSDTTSRLVPEATKPTLRFPTAFSPSPNGSSGGYYNINEPNNQVFYPKYSEKPTTYNLQIFNKAGELIFESKEIEIGWDGYYKEAPVAQGVYIYQCTGTWKNGEPYNYRGDITILWTQN